ncbi:MAG: hypothetical protein ACRC33_10030, partial [Gemmataceae bacterium]
MKSMKKLKLALISLHCEIYKAAVEELVPKSATAHPALAGDLTQVHKISNKLVKAFTSMAARNLLSDLLRSLIKIDACDLSPPATGWSFTAPKKGGIGSARENQTKVRSMEGAATARANQGVADAKAMNRTIRADIQELLGAHSPTIGRYSQVLLFGYKVKCAGDGYKGLTHDIMDVAARCKDMTAAIQGAYALANTMGNYNADGKILKVFMAPEFYFRGKNGAYSHALVHGQKAAPDAKPRPLPEIPGILDRMAVEIDKLIYKDWLFVLGTAIAATEFTETVCLVCKGELKFNKHPTTFKTTAVCTKDEKHQVGTKNMGAYVENVALLRKEKKSHTVSKDIVSHVDFENDKVKVEGKELPVHTSKQTSHYNVTTAKKPKFDDERMGGSIFTIDGVTYGLEVCIDHGATRESNSSGRLEHAGNIQIQLIPSAGMTIGRLRTVAGGVVFNVDGTTPHVQVVAGAVPKVRQLGPMGEFKFKGATWEDLKSVGLNFDPSEGTTLLDLENDGKGQLLDVTKTAHIAPAGLGAVVGYGPYNI